MIRTVDRSACRQIGKPDGESPRRVITMTMNSFPGTPRVAACFFFHWNILYAEIS